MVQAEQVNNHMWAIKQKQEHESQLSLLTSALLEAKKELVNARCQPATSASAANDKEVNENQQQLGKQCSLRMCVSQIAPTQWLTIAPILRHKHSSLEVSVQEL